MVQSSTIISSENRDSGLIIHRDCLYSKQMSLLLKRWRCVDDEIPILTEEEYRVHTEMHPSHRIVTEDGTVNERGNGMFVRFEAPAGAPLFQLEEP